MKRVLYITNIEVPYRVQFFNELAKHCELTVLYERQKSNNRDKAWTSSEVSNYQVRYLNGLNVGDEYTFSFKILRYIFGKYDELIFGCYNSPVQMFATVIMRILHVPYILSTDGEVFIKGNGVKQKIKKFFLAGAKRYLAAGENAAESLGQVVDKEKIAVYYFSSLSKEELKEHAQKAMQTKRNDTVLVVGQYFDYKGLDVALKAAKKDESIKYKFVGMGKRTDLFLEQEQVGDLKNVEIIPFLSKEKLEREYQTCAMLVLPTRQECWGLVVNEAASYGMPIVSTWGSGAAVEFLADGYPQYLVEPDNAEALYGVITEVLNSTCDEYAEYLLQKGKAYCIEHAVEVHLECINDKDK